MILLGLAVALAADPAPRPCVPFLLERRVGADAPGVPAADACAGLRLDLAGRGAIDLPDVGLTRRLELSRARLELGVWGVGPATARVALIAARSGGATGYVGIDGEAIVPTIQIAEARVDAKRWGLAAAVGLVDDPWVIHGEDGWALRPVAAAAAELRGMQHRADLGGWVAWTSPGDWVAVAVTMTTGEGALAREQNEGKDVAATVSVRPFAAGPGGLTLELYGRNGSRGVASARDHRVGGRVTWEAGLAAVGAEALAGWGQQADAALLPLQTSVWARTGPKLPVVGWLRVDAGLADRAAPASGAVTWRAGAGPWLPWGPRAAVRPASLVLGYEGTWLGLDARSVAGASAAAVTHTLFLQLGVRFDAGLPISLAAVRGPVDP